MAHPLRLLSVFFCGYAILIGQVTDLNDQKARASLLAEYAQSGNSEGYVEQLLWFVENHPETVPVPRAQLNPLSGPLKSPADYERVKASWEAQLSANQESPAILCNAALLIQFSDLSRAINLLEQARKLAPDSPGYPGTEAVMYATAFTNTQDGKPFPNLSDTSAETLQQQVLNSEDAELLSATGRVLLRDQDSGTRKFGLQLMERAVSVDPSNPKWQQALATAKNGGLPTDAVRIGGQVAEANLIRKVDPIYPPLAKAARVSGTVEFTVVIGKDGAIENMQLVRGHPLLVNPAKEAVLQWKYRPTLLNGNPVRVITSVIVNFTLTQQ